MPVGTCSCGAVYAYDATGHNLGAAFIEALVFSCNMYWELAWDLIPEKDYLEKLVEHYDYDTHLIVPGGFYQGRRISGALYFIKLHQGIREATCREAPKKLDGAPSLPPAPSSGYSGKKVFTKGEVEKLVREYQVEPLLNIARGDRRILRDLQRLLYTGDELLRLKTADILGRASAVVASQDPGSISKLLQNLLASVSEPGASNWGALDAIGEIIRNMPEIFAGYIPVLCQFLENKTLRLGSLRAIGRIAGVRPDLVRKWTFRFLSLLHDPEPQIRGYAAWVLANLGVAAVQDELRRLQGENQEVAIYEGGKIEKKTIGQLASEALERER
ncbi:MAG: hypothetical protein PWP65_759 [Clostridia bacterium]|nr:hypothetical protein [Clostridia bacterium]